MPPLCAAGYGIAAASPPLFLSALYEFGINVVFIALAAEGVLLALRVPLKRDLNDDGIVTDEESRLADELSRKVRRRVIAGTIVFAIPCMLFTAGSIGSASQGVQDGYGVVQTTRELAAVLPGLEDYSVGSEVSANMTGGATDGGAGSATREVVARVATQRELSDAEKETARRLIRLNVPGLTRVEFSSAS